MTELIFKRWPGGLRLQVQKNFTADESAVLRKVVEKGKKELQ